jgi:hypothetical protein
MLGRNQSDDTGYKAELVATQSTQDIEQFVLTALRALHYKSLEPCDDLVDQHFNLYKLGRSLEESNEYGITYPVLQDRLSHIHALMTPYQLTFEQALIFSRLKFAIKNEFSVECRGKKNLIEFSNELTRARIIDIGLKAGLSNAEVVQVLPALASSLIKREIKFALKGFKAGLFAGPKELVAAFQDMEGKYEECFGLSK